MHPHHDPREQTHAFATVRVRYHVPVADGEEGDGDEPHGAQEVTGHFLFVMIPAGTQRSGASVGEGRSARRRRHAGERWCRRTKPKGGGVGG